MEGTRKVVDQPDKSVRDLRQTQVWESVTAWTC